MGTTGTFWTRGKKTYQFFMARCDGGSASNGRGRGRCWVVITWGAWFLEAQQAWPEEKKNHITCISCSGWTNCLFFATNTQIHVWLEIFFKIQHFTLRHIWPLINQTCEKWKASKSNDMTSGIFANLHGAFIKVYHGHKNQFIHNWSASGQI